jgi:hypothetical protein
MGVTLVKLKTGMKSLEDAARLKHYSMTVRKQKYFHEEDNVHFKDVCL